MKKSRLAILVVVFLILAILAACVLAKCSGPPAGLLALGGPLLRGGARGGSDGAAAEDGGPPPRHHPHDLHPLGIALEQYSRTLGPEHVLAVHPLDRDRYGPLSREASGGAAKGAEGGAAKKSADRKKKAGHWSEYETWKEMHADKKAVAAYFAQRAEALNNPDFDWGAVLRELAPRLRENREYIGLVNVGPDGRTLRLGACKASPTEATPIEAGTRKSATSFASVPAELVRKYAERPALFMFHTHPADPRCDPKPSSHDLSTAVYLGATGRFAASVVVSRYGVFAYTLDWAGYKAVNEAKNWGLALSNLSHDVVAAHEAVRSWSTHTLADYLAFYPRHRLVLVAWPSPEMVADGRRYTYLWDLETPIEHELIAEHRDDMLRHLRKESATLDRRHLARQVGAPTEADLQLD